MSEFDEVPEVTDEEKLQIAQHYLLSSPPGQFQEVLSDVRKLVSTDLLSEALVSGIARVSNLKNSKIAVLPSGRKVVLCSAAEVDPTHYVDPIDSSIFSLNHLTMATEKDVGAEYSPENHNQDLRMALQSTVDNYVSMHYQSELSAGSVYEKDGKLVLVITGEKNNLKNFWSGKWSSTWTVTTNGGSARVGGEIKLHVHYFEDGNLQLQSSKTVPAVDISGANEKTLAEEITKFIQTQETSLQGGLEEMYSNMNNETFRSMRRIMPITRTKMEWNVNAVRMVRQVRK